MDDPVIRELQGLKGQLPEPRRDLTEIEKDQLIKTIGGFRTVQNIVKAKKDYSINRIPFLFNSLDTQAVVDVLANDMTAAINRAKAMTG